MAKTPGNNPDWRGSNPDPARKRKQGWQQTGQPDAVSTRRKRSRTFKAVATLAAFFGTLGAILALILILRPPPRADVLLFYARYENNLAAPHGEHYFGSVQRIAALWNKLAPKESFFSPENKEAVKESISTGILWSSFIDKEKLNSRAKSLVVYVGAHGGVDDDGPYLLPTNAEVYPKSPDVVPGPQNRLRLAPLLEALAADTLRNRAKLLVLDCAQMTENAPLGMMHNDFVAKVKLEVDKFRDKVFNLAVICSSGPNQRSWPSNELKGTFFGVALSEVLTGGKPEMLDKNGEGVTVRSLYAYLKSNVEARVQLNRKAFQSPVIYYLGDQAALDGKSIVLANQNIPDFEKPFELDGQRLRELEDEWQFCAKLQAQAPPPWTYHPEAWRVYLDSVLRAESLIRVGANDIAGQFLQSARGTRSEFERRVKLDSTSTSLAMHESLGQPERRAEAAAVIKELWAGSAAGAARSLGAAPIVELYGAAVQRLREREIAQGFDKDLRDTFVRVTNQIAANEKGPRPVEAHLPYMLGVDLPKVEALSDDHNRRLLDAVKLRVTAERVALGLDIGSSATGIACPERIFHAFGSSVEMGDQRRRWGEDYLFSLNPEFGPQCAQWLAEAKSHYDRAAAAASGMRRAAFVRDRAAWELPYLSHWAASRDNAEEAQKDVADISDCWDALHRLDAALMALGDFESMGKAVRSEGAKVAGLEAEAKKISDTLDKIQRRTDERVSKAIDAKLGEQLLPEGEPALLLPFLAANKRITVLRSLASYYAEKLNDKKTETAADAEKTEIGRTWLRAVRFATLTLRAIGQADYEAGALVHPVDKKSNRSERYSSLLDSLDRIRASQGNDGNSELTRTEAAKAVAKQLSLHVRGLPAAVRGEASNARRFAAERKPALTHTLQAERWSRKLDGAGALLLLDPNPDLIIRPAETLRDLQLAHFLVWQAGRALGDRWFDVDKPGAPDPRTRRPYFRPVAMLLAADARSLASNWVGRPPKPSFVEPAFNQLADATKLDGELKVVAAKAGDVVHVTTQDKVAVAYKLTAGLGWVDGFPVVSLSANNAAADKGLMPTTTTPLSTPMELKGPGATTRDGPAVSFVSPFLAEAEKTPPTAPSKPVVPVSVDAVFRGQRPQDEVRFALHPLAQSILGRDPAAAGQSVSVFAAKNLQDEYGLSNGTVVFVLDCSGSMRDYADREKLPKDGREKDEEYYARIKPEERRFIKVCEALKKILKELPKGTRVSVWAYSHKSSIHGTDEDPNQKGVRKFPKKHGSEEQPEDRIERLTKSVIDWGGSESDEFREIVRQIDALVPEEFTPLARAMVEAKVDFAGARGLRTMIVLTDGMDTTFEFNPRYKDVHKGDFKGDPKYNPKGEAKKIAPFLKREFADSGIVPRVLGIALDESEDKEVRELFKASIEIPSIGGKYILIDNVDRLAKELNQQLIQEMRYKLLRDDVEAPGFVAKLKPGEQALRVSFSPASPEWLPKLDSTKYKLALSTNRDNVVTRPVALGAGDRLLVSVEKDARSGGLVFRRDLLRNRTEPVVPTFEAKGWLASVLECRKVEVDGIRERALLAIESQPRANEDSSSPLAFVRPMAVWLEGTGAADPQRGFRWRGTFEWPAPTWTADWPMAPNAGLNAWWTDEKTALSEKIERVMKRGQDFQSAEALIDPQGALSRNIGAAKFWIEDISFAKRFVRVDKDKPPAQRQCLTIRVRHEPKSPIWLRELNLGHPFDCEEHRFFAEANSMTALFWNEQGDNPIKDLAGIAQLTFVAVPAFKAACAEAGFTAAFAAPSGSKVELERAFLFSDGSK